MAVCTQEPHILIRVLPAKTALYDVVCVKTVPGRVYTPKLLATAIAIDIAPTFDLEADTGQFKGGPGSLLLRLLG